VQLTRYLGQKDSAFWYVDTHAGAGAYALDSGQAAKLAEYRDGIGRLWGRQDLPSALQDYLGLVRAANPDGRLKIYPGSPSLAMATTRTQDRLRLFELHSRDVVRLREHFAACGKRVIVEEGDGFAALKALLPPPPRRALVLIDPSYEERRDYDRVVHSLRESLSRFEPGQLGNDSGAVCTDENGTVTLTEADVNLKIATLVQESLNARGFQVELLNEFDTRLNGYRAAALVSIHNDSCEYVNDEATGFKVAASLETRDANRAQRLTACMVDRYGQITGLTFHANSITADMTQYHAFSEIDPNTITAIIETGFLNLDRRILTEQTDVIAEGVTQGILCFINNESVLPDQFPLPTILP